MRAMNRATILDAIRNAGLISRIDLASATGLSRASVTGLTSDLLQENLIIEKKSGDYDGGRRPMLLALNPNGAFAVGVNLSITELSIVIINFIADVIASHKVPLVPVQHSVDQISEQIINAVQACIWDANFAKEQISGVGIGIPGPVDAVSGKIRFLPNYGWENVNLRDRVQQGLKHTCHIDNSSNTLALAEQWFGDGKGVSNFLVVTIQNGVGLGAVINGRLYRGKDGTAGEFGHITLDPEGPLCRCGKKGCVEAYAGNNSILRDARQAILDNQWQYDGPPDDITYEVVVDAARNGSVVLNQIFSHAGEMLGTGISHLITLFNPSKIIITGKGVLAGDLLFEPMNNALKDEIPAKFGRSSTQIMIQSWTEEDWARGAGALVFQELYKSPVGQMAADR